MHSMKTLGFREECKAQMYVMLKVWCTTCFTYYVLTVPKHCNSPVSVLGISKTSSSPFGQAPHNKVCAKLGSMLWPLICANGIRTCEAMPHP